MSEANRGQVVVRPRGAPEAAAVRQGVRRIRLTKADVANSNAVSAIVLWKPEPNEPTAILDVWAYCSQDWHAFGSVQFGAHDDAFTQGDLDGLVTVQGLNSTGWKGATPGEKGAYLSDSGYQPFVIGGGVDSPGLGLTQVTAAFVIGGGDTTDDIEEDAELFVFIRFEEIKVEV